MPIVSPHRIPVIVGIADVIDRPADLARAREPATLMADALFAAFQDAVGPAAASLLAALDSLDIVAEHSWPYAQPSDVLSTRIGHAPKRCVYGVAGGESPVRFIHEAALRIASGDSTVAAIVGAEAAYSVATASKQSVQLPWSPRGSNAGLLRGKDLCHPIAISHGMTQPVHVYPFYENAATASWGQTPAEAMRESAELWSDFSKVAAENPCAWLKQPYSIEQLATPSPDNRPVAWPYTKHMIANPFVNQGAAVVLTSLAKACELGVAEERCVYIHAGAHATEPSDYLQRDQYQRSYAQEAVLEAMRETASRSAPASGRFDAVELYSCFPIVPKMARRVLQLPSHARLTSIGGLSFFGAPLNNYMTHAAAGLVRQLRNQRDGVALLYGQGEFITKHHALLLSSTPPQHDLAASDGDVQARADRHRRPVPELIDDLSGPEDSATAEAQPGEPCGPEGSAWQRARSGEFHGMPAALETFTVVYGRGHDPEFGTVIARTAEGRRLMARVPASDTASLQVLTNLSATPIGRVGQVTRSADHLLNWTVT
jgi:acetyl-CoA C-acetyltransferase